MPKTREEKLQYYRDYYQKHKERYRNQQKKYASEKYKERRKQRNASPKHKLFVYKRGAERKGRSWELTDEQFFALLKEDCRYCGKKNANGVDRYYNSEGYEVENSIPCCALCNHIKCNYDWEEIRQHMCKVIEYTSD